MKRFFILILLILPGWPGILQALGERMQSLGIIQKQPDYTALIDPSFVQAVKRSPDVK